MRCISHIRQFCLVIQAGRSVMEQGYEKVIVPHVEAQFWRGDVTAEEVRFAERHFGKLHGRTTEIDQVTPTSILSRLSIFDTDESEEYFQKVVDEANLHGLKTRDNRAYTVDYVRQMTEEKLLSRSMDNRNPDFAVVEAVLVDAPFPAYEQFQGTAEELVERIAEMGLNLNQALAYEEQRSPKRTHMIQLYRAAIEEHDASVTADPAAGFITA